MALMEANKSIFITKYNAVYDADTPTEKLSVALLLPALWIIHVFWYIQKKVWICVSFTFIGCLNWCLK